ncbi:MAG: DUF1015 domain-containing protein [Oscillospiraceae bacterium]|nr:DUF1015 domain-containing protein [Oscillospiraceae bacterium]
MPVFQRADLLIPRQELLPLWPVVACDQFTSQSEYWRRTAEAVGSAPSAYHIIFPEAELGTHEEERIMAIGRTMAEYLAGDVFRSFPQCYVYVERTLQNGAVRKGVIGVVDLEAYDYRDEAKTPIRATERTVVSRIPPRVRIRSGAPIESSHVLLLCSDGKKRLIEQIRKGEKLYDLELMQGGGHLSGWLVDGEEADRFDERMAAYMAEAEDGFCFAVGDGNHSLAAAKACWEEIRRGLDPEAAAAHPARWAMVELENLFDPAQQFEPIHRIVRGVDTGKLLAALGKKYDRGGTPVLWYTKTGGGILRFDRDALPLESLQRALDEYLDAEGGSIDYIHGEDVALRLGREEGAIAFLLPRIEKDALFRSIASGGALPRKTFSMGHAEEKRYYLECRRILP